MSAKNDAIAGPSPFKRRVPVVTSWRDMVAIETPVNGDTLPVIIRPAVAGVELSGWASMARDEIERLLLRHGGILFRGFGVNEEAGFERFIQTVSGELLPYIERSSPRTQVQGNVYTSTDHPPDQSIFLHCENSYQKSWPRKIFFYCHVEPRQGGETPIADTRRILKRVSPAVREGFERKGVMYVRNFGSGLGLSWQSVFQTEDRDTVERYCREAGIECVWRGPDGLMTRHVRPAIRKHPVTGEDLWFNHAVFFHISTLPPETQTAIRAVMAEDEFPNNTFYGDGSPIPNEALEQLRSAYEAETVCLPWIQGDILMLDNMLAAHGRRPFSGARKILVGMTDSFSC